MDGKLGGTDGLFGFSIADAQNDLYDQSGRGASPNYAKTGQKHSRLGIGNSLTNEILPLNWTATKICNLVVNYEKRT